MEVVEPGYLGLWPKWGQFPGFVKNCSHEGFLSKEADV